MTHFIYTSDPLELKSRQLVHIYNYYYSTTASWAHGLLDGAVGLVDLARRQSGQVEAAVGPLGVETMADVGGEDEEPGGHQQPAAAMEGRGGRREKG